MKNLRMLSAAAVIGASVLAGCAATETRTISTDSRYGSNYNSVNSRNYGVIEQIDLVKAGSNNAAGAIIGGVIGGVIGHQVGSGRGNDVATVAGVVGGAVIGNEVQKNNNARETYQIRVRLENGSSVVFAQDSIGDLRAGDRVRVENDRVYRY